jgi:hypothetical protein
MTPTTRRAPVHLNRLPDDRPGAAESPLPQRIAQDDDAGSVGIGVRGLEGASRERRNTEDIEEGGRHGRCVHALRLVTARQVGVHFGVRAERREAGDVVRVALDLGCREPRRLGQIRGAPDDRDPIGLAVGQRLEQHVLDHAEDRGVRADPERERRDRHQGEARRVTHETERVDQIACKGGQQRRTCLHEQASIEAPVQPQTDDRGHASRAVPNSPPSSTLREGQFVRARIPGGGFVEVIEQRVAQIRRREPGDQPAREIHLCPRASIATPRHMRSARSRSRRTNSRPAGVRR